MSLFTSETIVSGNITDITNLHSVNKTGLIVMYPAIDSSDLPPYWELCNGQSLSTTAYPELFALIGYNYGGSGESFNIPNFNNCLARAGTIGADWGPFGAENTTLTVENFPGHSHSVITTSASTTPSASYASSHLDSYSTNRGVVNFLASDGRDQLFLQGWGTARGASYLDTRYGGTRDNALLSISETPHSHVFNEQTTDAAGGNDNTYSILPAGVKLYFIIKVS